MAITRIKISTPMSGSQTGGGGGGGGEGGQGGLDPSWKFTLLLYSYK